LGEMELEEKPVVFGDTATSPSSSATQPGSLAGTSSAWAPQVNV